ncbi:MAG: hypothetical protein ACP5LF_04665 [Nitrososphaeria archaeon]|nr:hypothetical protein [Conexivisphaerales archaeon]
MHKLYDDFKVKSELWNYRTENFASIEVDDENLKMCVGPSEALYYSDAEISDGGFETLKWDGGKAEFKVKLSFDHFGSAGFGFWNYSMVTDISVPIWFIYLNSRGKYPLKGFFAQAGRNFCPIFLNESGFNFSVMSFISRLFPSQIGVKILSSKPAIRDLNKSSYHLYRIEWKGNLARFYIDNLEFCSVQDSFLEGKKARLDVWIDNSVFMPVKNDPGKVYRHATQELREKHCINLKNVDAESLEL